MNPWMKFVGGLILFLIGGRIGLFVHDLEEEQHEYFARHPAL